MRSAFVQIIAALTAGVAAFSLAPEVMAQDRQAPRRPPIPPQIEALLDAAPEDDQVIRWKNPPQAHVNDFPQRALDHGLSGSATLSCIAPADGRIRFCKIISETPEGYGFGESAINIVARGRLEPDPDPQAVNVFRVRMPFNLN